MINRVLIRIKVVQLLYSFLLTDNQFMLESQPSAPTKEKRFAYNLYLDILMLMVKISERIEKRGGYRPLADTRFIKKILADDKMKSQQMKYNREPFPFDHIAYDLADIIVESGLYKNFIKDVNANGPEDDKIWEKLFDLIIIPNPALNSAFSSRENYTVRGVERMKDMIRETFTQFYASRDNIDDALRTLALSMSKARELYFRLLLLPVELTNLRERQIDENRNKYIPTQDDLNPNMRFVENALVESIRNDEEVDNFVEQNRLSWYNEDPHMLESLLKEIMNSEIYDDYINFPATDYHTDCEFWRNVYKHIIFDNEDFLDSLETRSVYWNDDIDIIGTFLLKTFKRYEENAERGGGHAVLPMYKDQEDADFGKRLFADVVRNKDLYRRYIDDSIVSERWDSERLAFMDVIVTMTALAEICNFPKIPLVVSINEYIEIAKAYSTSKSGAFVNGLLYSISNRLIEEGKIAKRLS